MRQNDDILTLTEVCAMLGVHKNTLREWDKKGVLKAMRFGVRQDRRYKRDDVLRILQEKTTNSIDSYGDSMRVKKAEQAIDRLGRLQLLNAAISTALEPKKVAGIIVDQAMSALHASAGAIYCLNEDQQQLDLLNETGYDNALIKKLQIIPLNTQVPTAEVAKLNEPLFFETHDELLLHYPGITEFALAASINAYAGLPLRIRGEVFGVFALGFDRDMYFSKDDITFMLALAHQCEFAFERAQLYEKEKNARLHMQEIQAGLVQIFDDLRFGCIALSSNGQCTYLNSSAEKILQQSKHSVLGKRLWEIFPEIKTTSIEKQLQKITSNHNALLNTTVLIQNNTSVIVHVYPSSQGLLVFLDGK